MAEEAVETAPRDAPIYYPINSLDERLCVTNSLPYAIERSGQAIMGYQQQASSASTTNVQFTLNVPNLSTIIDRHIYIRTTLTWTLSGANGNAGVSFLSNGDGAGGDCIWGRNMAFAPFPFQQMVQNVVVTINQQPISINLQEALPSLMRYFEKDVLAESSNQTPCMLDHFQSYNSGFGAITAPNDANVLGDGTYSKALDGIKPRGSYYVTVTDNAGNGGTTATVTATIVEPLILSPFLLGYMNSNQQGMYGIQNINFNFTLNSAKARSIRVAPNMVNVTGCALTTITQASTYLDVMYITPPSGSKLFLPARNEVPYMQSDSQRTSVPAIVNGSSYQAWSNDYQLSKMPDKVLICVRKKFSDQACQDSDCYLPITGLSATFGGNSGLLASCSQHQLWQMAVRNGSNQTWDEFSGVSSQASAIQPARVATCGSVACLAFGRDLAIADPFTVPGSLGSVNFQIGVTVTNNLPGGSPAGDIAADAYEVFLVFLYSGFFVNELSTSSIVLGFVDKSTVEKASGQDHQDQNGTRRIYGGGIFSSLGKVFKGMKPFAKPLAGVAKSALGSMSDPRAKALSSAIGALGGGMTAGNKFAGRLH